MSRASAARRFTGLRLGPEPGTVGLMKGPIGPFFIGVNQSDKGRSETGRLAGAPIFRSQVSAIGIRARVFRFRFGFRKSVLCHRFSHLSISGGRWQPRVAGGGAFPFSPPFSPQRSPPFSPPCSAPPSVLCHRFSHRPFRLAGVSPGWRVAGLLHSALNAVLRSVFRARLRPLSSAIDSVIDPAICPRPSPRFPLQFLIA